LAEAPSEARATLSLVADKEKNLCLLETGEPGKMFSSCIADELLLIAHSVGIFFTQDEGKVMLSTALLERKDFQENHHPLKDGLKEEVCPHQRDQ
jgi:hypothetical protein